jgi:DNA-binding NarL/FixJ family response regulator/signal transduction histidine kinase
LLLFLLWVPVAFFRQIVALTPGEKGALRRLLRTLCHPALRETRALRSFALIFLFVAGLSVFNILRGAYVLSVSLANIGISLGILGSLFAFAVAYINHQPETTSFIIKLAGVTLTVMLAVLSVVGWVVLPFYEAHFRPSLPDQQALRFTPNALGGYDIDEIPFAFEADLGIDLQLDDGLERGCSDPFPFAFPFYGTAYTQVIACNDGVISLGQPMRYREFQYRYGAGAPLVMALLMDLDPTISVGGIFARQEPDRLIVTWDRLRGFRRPEAELTFQATLYLDGSFDLAYLDLPDMIRFQPNDDPGASAWAIGAVPGNLRGLAPQAMTLTGLPVQSGAGGVIQDYLIEFRQHLHEMLVPLAWLILGSSALIVVSFPLLLQLALVNPLNALLSGVRQLEGGDYAIDVPVRYSDEIGFLTQVFNGLASQLGDLIHNLEERVANRTAELDAANAQLRAEIAERERAHATIIEQQRTLAAFEEREELGRELHDGLGQVLGYVNVQAQATSALLDRGQAVAAQTNLQQLAQAARQAHDGVRAYILGLRTEETPQPVGQYGFFDTLHAYVAQFQTRYGLTPRLWVPDDAPDPLFAPAVEEQVVRIVQEALTNVAKHAQATYIDITFNLIGEAVQIAIVDDGVGFDVIQRQAAEMDRSSQLATRDSFGLAIMRERAERVGGRVTIQSTPGQGTRVMLAVPRFLPTDDQDPGSVRGLRILLADDHPLFLDGLRNLLLARGMTVVGVALDGQDAVEKVRALQPDVAVVDLNMPRLDGLEATRIIKAEFPEVKVVILTVSEDREMLFQAIKSGASGYLLKSLEANRFCSLLTGMLQGEAALAPGMTDALLAEFARSATPGEAGPEAVLTPRQMEVLTLVAQGLTYKEVGEALHLSERTIKYHMGNILEALDVQNRAEAIAYLARHET